MRVLNDRQEKTEPTELGFFTIAAYAILSAFGIATVILGPLPMILAHARMADPWPKVTALLGAVIALTFLEVPLPMVVLTFIFSLFVSDRVWSGGGMVALFRDALLLATVAALAALVLMARIDHVTLAGFWQGQVDSMIHQLQSTISVDKSYNWSSVKALLQYEGPFFYLSGVLLSCWLSIGMSAHLGWLETGHRYSAEALRSIRFPFWASAVFGVLFIGAFSGNGTSDVQRVVSGLFRIASCFMFMQGTICLSVIFNRKGVSARSRTLIYGVAVVLGFYALVGMGAISPWLFKKSFKHLEEVT